MEFRLFPERVDHHVDIVIALRSGVQAEGQKLEVPLGALCTSDTVLAVGSTSTFREAESIVIIEALRAAAGRIAGRGGEPPNGSD
jgi:hypothetical protein